MDKARSRPAFYAVGTGGWRDWWVLLHPPYTAWHLSYVVLAASLAPTFHLDRLVATLAAFALAVGISAHALDETHGRPLGTRISSRVLYGAAVVTLLGACGLGVAGVAQVGPGLLVFIPLGAFLVFAYNLELFGGVFHSDAGFALAWGAFPVLTGYYAQGGRLDAAAFLAAAAAFALSMAQRSLSMAARTIRRRTQSIEGTMMLRDGSVVQIDERALLQPLERGLRWMSWATVALALGLIVARLAL